MEDKRIKLSVIIPVYNAKMYLEQCLKSVVSITSDEIEILLINDGSTDSSREICEKWQTQDQRIHVIHKKNGGVSSARNIGIDNCSGKYIIFMDADDVFTENWWELLSAYMENSFEFIAFSYLNLYEDGKTREEAFPGEAEILDTNEINEILLATPLLHTCWGKLFLAENVKRNNCYFPEDMIIGEDYFFVLNYMKYAKERKLINTPILYYRQTPTGAMHKFDYDIRIGNMQKLRNYAYGYMYTENLVSDILISKMSIYYFKGLTKLMRDIATMTPNIAECRKVYGKLMCEELFADIVEKCQYKKLPFYKRIEYYMLKVNSINIVALYFKIKSFLSNK